MFRLGTHRTNLEAGGGGTLPFPTYCGSHACPVPEGEQHAVEAALAMQTSVLALHPAWRRRSLPPRRPPPPKPTPPHSPSEWCRVSPRPRVLCLPSAGKTGRCAEALCVDPGDQGPRRWGSHNPEREEILPWAIYSWPGNQYGSVHSLLRWILFRATLVPCSAQTDPIRECPNLVLGGGGRPFRPSIHSTGAGPGDHNAPPPPPPPLGPRGGGPRRCGSGSGSTPPRALSALSPTGPWGGGD